MDKHKMMAKRSSFFCAPLSNGPLHLLPLVVLLDSDDLSAELPLLKDVATLHVCKAQNASELDEKVFNEAVGILVSNTFILTKEDLVKFQKLHVLIRIGSSVDNIDVKAAGQLRIAVCNVPKYGLEDVADTTFCLILNLYTRTYWLANMVREHKSTERVQGPVQCCSRIRGNTLGIIGLGRIGKAVALRAKAFGFNVIFYDPYVEDGAEQILGLSRIDTLQDLLFQSDCVSLHCTLNDYNHHLINEMTIKQMKPGAFLINTAGGGLVNDDALATALMQGKIKAAALDVHHNETHSVLTGPLRDAPNLLCTPQTAFFSEACDTELLEMASVEMRKALKGGILRSLRNCVNTEYFPGPRYYPECLASPENYYQGGTPNVQHAHLTTPSYIDSSANISTPVFHWSDYLTTSADDAGPSK